MFTKNDLAGNFYHVYNRGVDKKEIFLDSDDKNKFINDLERYIDDRVEIVAFCLLDNHYHLLLRKTSEEGIWKYMHKLATGYTLYFNKKYGRSGSLFESRYKSNHINNNAYFLHISKYIHLNAVDRIKSNSSNSSTKYLTRAMKIDPYSSYGDYVSNRNLFPFLNKIYILECFSSYLDYENFIFENFDDTTMEVQPRG